jgi:hypothetical protein
MDLDDLIRTELTAQAERAPDAGPVLAGARVRHRARRRNRLVATGAAVAAVLAIAVPYATLDRPGPGGPTVAGSPTPTAPTPTSPPPATRPNSYRGHPIPSDAEILARCLPGRAGAKVLAVFADEYGWIASARVGNLYEDTCMYSWSDKTLGNVPPSGPYDLPTGYLPAGRLAEIIQLHGGGLLTKSALRDGTVGHPAKDFIWVVTTGGNVSPDVRRLVLHWDKYSADVPVYGPYWVGRVVLPATVAGNPAPEARLLIEAFDGSGHRLGTYQPRAYLGGNRELPEVRTTG